MKKGFFVGATALLLMASMNFSHAFNEYGFLNRNLCGSILALTTTTGTGSTSTGGGNSTGGSSSGGNTSTGTNSGSSSNPLLEPKYYDIKTERSETKENGKLVQESIVSRCYDGKFMLDCKNTCTYRARISNDQWTEWRSCEK